MLLKVRTRIKQTDTETDATKRRIAKAALLNINLTDSKFKKNLSTQLRYISQNIVIM